MAEIFTSSTFYLNNLLNIISDTSHLSPDLKKLIILPENENDDLLSYVSKEISTKMGSFKPQKMENCYNFEELFDSEGRLISISDLKAKIFEFGVEDKYRMIAYKYILGYYDPLMTLDLREKFDKEKRYFLFENTF